MAAPDVRGVLEFLRQNGFDRAASALGEDVLAGVGRSPSGFDSAAEEEEAIIPPWLPPVRVGSARRSDDGGGCGDGGGRSGSGSSASSSSDAFVSMGSSPSGLTNPYGLWTAYPAESEDSSDRLSQFATARDYDDPNVFGDTFWDDPYLMKESSGGFINEDKFIMSIDAEEHFVAPKDLHLAPERSPKTRVNNCSEMYACSVSHCDCPDGMREYHGRHSAEEVEVLNPSLLEIPFPVSSSAESYSRVDEKQCEGMERTESHILEKELDMLSSFTFPCCDPLYDLKSRSSSSNAKESFAINKSGKDFENVSDLIDKRVSQPNGKDAVEKYGKSDIVSHDREYMGGKEAHVINDDLQLHDSHEDEYEVFNLRIIHRKNRTGFEENKDFPIVLKSIIAGRYYVTEYLGSAAFSKVVQAHDLLTGMDVCLKIINNDKDFFDQSLDEIKLLKFVNKHDPADEHHILRLYDYFYYQEHLFIVCELLRANLYEFQKFNEDSEAEVYFTLARIQKTARQCLEALEYLHHLGVIHCDLKPENILIKSYSRCEIKIIDLGSSCFRTDNLCLYVQSRSYRAPEVILGLPYDEKIDIWSLGCILAELFTGDVLFPNDELVLLLARMIGMLGPIDREMLEMGQETHKYFTDDYDLYHRNEETDQVEYIIPEKSSLPRHLKGSDTAFVEFLKYMLQLNPQRRPTAKQALQHPWLTFCMNELTGRWTLDVAFPLHLMRGHASRSQANLSWLDVFLPASRRSCCP